MYILEILNAIKKIHSKNSETLYMKTIIDKLDLLKKTVSVQ